MAEETEGKGHSVTLTAHGDGSYHTQEHGQPGEYDGLSRGGKPKGYKEHESFGAAIAHIAKHHGTAGQHVHVHGHEEGYTSHNVSEGGKVSGPHNLKNLSELKRSLTQFFDEEGQES
jgi:hypothetical protein